MRVIAFDGSERTGKSTQIDLLKKYLEGKGKKVASMHTSLLNGKDVTLMKITPEAKFFAYLASLTEAAIKIPLSSADYMLLDRFILTQLVYSKRYWSPTFYRYNELFSEYILNKVRGYDFVTLCFAQPYIKDASFDSSLNSNFVKVTYEWVKHVKTYGPAEDVHKHIKELLNI